MASILKSNVLGIPALFVLNPVSNFLGFTIEEPKKVSRLSLGGAKLRDSCFKGVFSGTSTVL